jgi:hypothetical protein
MIPHADVQLVIITSDPASSLFSYPNVKLDLSDSRSLPFKCLTTYILKFQKSSGYGWVWLEQPHTWADWCLSTCTSEQYTPQYRQPICSMLWPYSAVCPTAFDWDMWHNFHLFQIPCSAHWHKRFPTIQIPWCLTCQHTGVLTDVSQ